MTKLTIDNAEYLFSKQSPLSNDTDCRIAERFLLYHPSNPSIVIAGLVKYEDGTFGKFEGANGLIKTILQPVQVKFITSHHPLWKTTEFVAPSNIFETHKDNLYACFIESPLEHLKPCLVLGQTVEQAESTSLKIVTAINNTYAKGINPSAVPDMLEALKEIMNLSFTNDREDHHDLVIKAKSIAERLIKQATE